MSRSVGARAVYHPSAELRETLVSMQGRVADPTPVNQKIAYDARDEAVERLESGEFAPHAESTIARHGEHQIGVGEHGGFVAGIRPFWDARGAGWLTRYPHAHLFDLGTAEHHDESGKRVNIYNEKRGHVTRAESKKRLLASTTTRHQPARPFAYLSEALIERSEDRFVAFLLEGKVE